MLCVIAKTNAEATDRLQALCAAALPEAKPIYGHITVASYMGDNERRFIRTCKAMLKDVHAFTVVYGRIVVLSATSILVAVPESSKALESLHARIAERFGAELDAWTGMDRWYPHTTLYYDPTADLEAIRRTVQMRFCPFSARIARIEFSRVDENGCTIVDSAELSEDTNREE